MSNPGDELRDPAQPGPVTADVALREVTEVDLPVFFEQQLDEDANRMAAFTVKDPADRDAFWARWKRILGDETIIKKTIVVDGDVAGHISSFEQFGEKRSATGSKGDSGTRALRPRHCRSFWAT